MICSLSYSGTLLILSSMGHRNLAVFKKGAVLKVAVFREFFKIRKSLMQLSFRPELSGCMNGVVAKWSCAVP